MLLDVLLSSHRSTEMSLENRMPLHRATLHCEWRDQEINSTMVREESNVGEGTLGVAELAEHHVVGLITCEGGVDVVGVVIPLVRGGAQVLHGDQVVELSVLLEVDKKEEVGEDGEGQIEVESERGELKERRTCTWMT